MGPMGWCHEFGVEIEPACSHPMTAQSSTCACTECGVVCRGRFEGGCEAVWRRGPRRDAPGRPAAKAVTGRPRSGHNGDDAAVSLVNGTRVNGARSPGGVNGLAEDERVKQLQVALANLAQQVARQTQHLAVLDSHVSDLGRVLGQLGVEVDERITRLEG